MSEVCTTRSYGFAGSARSNRTQFAAATAPAAGGAACPVAPLGAATATYDSADRLVATTSDGSGQWVYDPFGRTTAMPAAAGAVTNAFFVNDLVQQQTQPGASRITWALDPLHRRTTNVIEEWVNGAWANSATKVSHYANDSDEPSWIAEDVTLPSDVTRYVSGVEGDVAVTTSTTGDRELQLVDLHGDVVGTLPIADGAAQATSEALRLTRNDEFGNPLPLTGAGATTGPPTRYGWLGAAQRSAEALGGVILMGVRLYSPTTGRFLSVDPVPGGSANAYDYCNADPVNCTDLAGTFSFEGLLSAVAVVGEVASFIPGPIGAAAAGISAVAYAAQSNTAKAVEMGVTAAAQLVGAGAVVRVAARAVNVARKTGQAARALPRAVRTTAQRVGSTVRRQSSSCPVPNSFAPGTQVVLGDGTLAAIEDVVAGDLVLSTDSITGEQSVEVVLAPIVGSGNKHLVTIVTSAGSWTATAEHPFWIAGHGWSIASDVRRGDALMRPDGTPQRVNHVIDHGVVTGQVVYNLHIAETHTYYVADSRLGGTVLVHNACGNHSFGSPGAFAAAHNLTKQRVLNAIELLKRQANVRVGGRRVDVEVCTRCGTTRPKGGRGDDDMGSVWEFMDRRRRK
ncbi:polymorphic toxin-type HINT domain-containing protein [Actinotalea solisilvae]|uniref:polymorphic toxin-type HINT domain-containing protein n=1 Tax=Actinotalea solisilvae TaxID=2072922 RepID=UPI0018F2785F|nr:polymorphic toxin-type HINT domain-containing protein [Actinotalea solisilvae]